MATESQLFGLDVTSGALDAVSVGSISDPVAAVAAVAGTGTLTVSDYTAIVLLTKATGTISIPGSQPADGNTFTVNGVTFTIKTTPLYVRDVPILGSATLTAQAIKAAINANSAALGVVASGSSTTITLTANVGGVGGNAITLTKVGANLSVSGAVLSGGLAADTIKIGDATFTFVLGAPATSFQVQKGSSATDQGDKIAAQVNLVPDQAHVSAHDIAGVVTFTAKDKGTLGNAIGIIAANATAFAISGATLTGGVDPTPQNAKYGLMIKNADGVNGTAAHYFPKNITASATDSALVTGVATKKIRVVAMSSQAGGTATTLVFNSKPAGAGVAISPVYANGVNIGAVLPYNPVGWFETVAGEALTATTGAGSTTSVLVTYILV